jgi:hypothetical protein
MAAGLIVSTVVWLNIIFSTNCAFGLHPSSGVSRTNKIEELKI